MSNHTPGPWSAYQRPSEIGTNYFRILLHGFSDEQPKYGQDSLAGYCGEANANLIAAAPDMLEALEFCMRVIGESDLTPSGGVTEEEIDTAYCKAKAAIAKAKGETQ